MDPATQQAGEIRHRCALGVHGDTVAAVEHKEAPAVTKQKLLIRGMHCSSCAMTIDEELEELEGVAEARTSFRKQIRLL